MGSSLHPVLQSLLATLSNAIGDRVVLDERGECGLEFDGDVDVVLAQVHDGEILSLRSPVSAVGQTLDATLLQEALTLNFTSMPPGYTLALDTDSGRLDLLSLIDTATTSADVFLSRVAGFVEMVPALREQFGARRASSREASIVRPGLLA
jgi:hypothetical protein